MDDEMILHYSDMIAEEVTKAHFLNKGLYSEQVADEEWDDYSYAIQTKILDICSRFVD